jgi:hypothetical protein
MLHIRARLGETLITLDVGGLCLGLAEPNGKRLTPVPGSVTAVA